MARPWFQRARDSEGLKLHRAIREFVLEGTGLVFLPLSLYGPSEGRILHFLESKSGWAETAHFQPQNPRGYWRGHVSGSEASWEGPTEEHMELMLAGPAADRFTGTRPWLVETLLPWQRSRVNSWQVRPLCPSPRT